MASDDPSAPTQSWLAKISNLCPGTHRADEAAPDNDVRDRTIDAGAPADVVNEGADTGVSLPHSTVLGTVPAIGSIKMPAGENGGSPTSLNETEPADLALLTGEEIVHRIRAKWCRSAADIIDVCIMCADLYDRYHPIREKYEELLASLPFDRPRFAKLQKAGHDQRLLAIPDRLPPSDSTICMLSRLRDDEFAEALASGLINPGLTREELRTWRPGRRPAAAGNAKVACTQAYATIHVAPDIAEDVWVRLNQSLRELAALPGINITSSRS